MRSSPSSAADSPGSRQRMRDGVLARAGESTRGERGQQDGSTLRLAIVRRCRRSGRSGRHAARTGIAGAGNSLPLADLLPGRHAGSPVRGIPRWRAGSVSVLPDRRIHSSGIRAPGRYQGSRRLAGPVRLSGNERDRRRLRRGVSPRGRAREARAAGHPSPQCRPRTTSPRAHRAAGAGQHCATQR